MDRLNQDSLRFILESAILAPSADNQHRVRFHLGQDALQVIYTESLPSPGGYKRALALLSVGALAENLAIAASRFGMRAEIGLFPAPERPQLIMQIQLQPHLAAVDPLWQSIPFRHANRRVYFKGPRLSRTERAELEVAAQLFPACRLHWLDETAQKRRALQLIRRAETARFRVRLLHEELFSAIRFEAGWHAASTHGLPPGALGVEPPFRGVFAMLRHWPVMRLANFLGAHHILGWRASDLPCRLAPHLGLLAVKNSDDQSVFDAGRAFQRIWLTATSQGRVLQPMPASAIFALDGAVAEGIPAELRRSLAEGWKAILGAGIPVMLFRMGSAKPLPIMAGRGELGSYLSAKDS